MLSGLFMWPIACQIHGGKGTQNASMIRDELESYDVVHVNYTPGNATYLSALRKILGDHSDTKLIVNVDFALMMWSAIDPHIMKDQLSRADMVFHVEHFGAERLGRYLGRMVHTLPHPVNVKKIKEVCQEKRLGGDSDMIEIPPLVVSTQYHRYMKSWCDAWYGIQCAIQGDKKRDFRTVLMNMEIGGNPGVAINSMFDDILGRAPYPQYLGWLAKTYANVDLTWDYTYGRGIVDAAAMGVPTIGSDTMDAARRLFPSLTVRPAEDGKIGGLLRNLLDDPDFAGDVAQEGYDKADFYGTEQAYARLIEALELENLI